MTSVSSTHEKAENLQSMLMNAMDKFLPQKTVSFSSDDSPWVNPQIKSTIRRRQREYRKNRRSDKWKQLQDKVIKMVSKAKTKYYANVVKYQSLK